MKATSGRGITDARPLVAFDPGRNVGVAYVASSGELLAGHIVAAEELATIAIPGDATVLVGGGTGHRAVLAALRARGLEPELVDESATTLSARELYFRDHPARGLGKLVPTGMRSPARGIDDYAAYAIALRWLAARAEQENAGG